MKILKKVNPEMINLFNSWVFGILRWIIFFCEAYLAKRVYQAIKTKFQFRKRVAQLRLLNATIPASVSPSPPTLSTDVDSQLTNPLHVATLLMLREALPSAQKNQLRHLTTGTFLAGVFAVVFLVLNYLFHPIVNRWALSLLPLWFPLLVLPLPYLLEMKPSRTLLLLLSGMGLSLLMLFIFGV
jgi:hypothetical protein